MPNPFDQFDSTPAPAAKGGAAPSGNPFDRFDAGPAGWKPEEVKQGWRHGPDGKAEFLPNQSSDGFSGYYADSDGTKRMHVEIDGPGSGQQQGSPPTGHVTTVAPTNGVVSGIRSFVDGVIPGVDRIAAGVDAVTGIDKLTGGDVQTIWDGHSLSGAYDHNLALQRAQSGANEEAHPAISLLGTAAGSIVSPISKIGAGIKGVGMAAKVARIAVPDAVYGASYGLSHTNDLTNVKQAATDTAVGAAAGAAGGLVGHGIVKGAGRVLAPVAAKGVRALREAGVELSPGQVLGGWAKKAEEKFSSVPILGTGIRQARERSIRTFQSGVVNDALKEIREKLPPGVSGNEAMDYAQRAFNRAYTFARNGMHFARDGAFDKALQDLQDRAVNGGVDSLTEQYQKQLAQTIKQTVERRMDAAGNMSGKTLKVVVSELNAKAAKMKAGNNPAEAQEYGQALKELSSLLDDAARRNPGSSAKAIKTMDAADRGYRKIVIAENAAKMRAGETGEFNPTQYDSAVQSADPSVRKRAYQAGRATGQALSEPGKKIIGRELPNSYTADRTLQVLGALGLTGAGVEAAQGNKEHAEEAAALIALGLGGRAAYTRTGTELAAKLLLDRPNALLGAGKQIQRLAKPAGTALAGTGNALASQYAAEHR